MAGDDDVIGQLYDACEDSELSVLDALVVRAGLRWECECGSLNEVGHVTYDICGKEREEG